MTEPVLTVTIDRTGMVGAPAPLVLLGHPGTSNTVLGCSDYREPAKWVNRRMAPPSAFAHGQVVLGMTYEQSLLSFTVFPEGATEAQGKAAIFELEAAIARLQFEVTVTVGDAPGLVYVCDAGEVVPVGDRTYTDLRYANPKWSVEIPCYPIPTEAP